MEITVLEDAAEVQLLRDMTLSELGQAAAEAGMPANTRTAYNKWWQDFRGWCEAAGRTPLPATSETITEYLTCLCYERIAGRGHSKGQTGLSPATVKLARWAIAKAHELAGAEVPSMNQPLQVIKGYQARLAETKNPRLRPRKAAAATSDVIQQVVAACPPGLTGLRDRCMLLLWYSTAARVSEAVMFNIEDVTIEGPATAPRGLTVALYRKKTRNDGALAIPAEHAPLTALAFRDWRDALAERGRTTGPLFVHLWRHYTWDPEKVIIGQPGGDPDGRLSIPGAEVVLQHAFQRAGLGSAWSGHSMRSGLATAARFAGHDQKTIASQTGHDPSSPVLLGYMADADKWTNNALAGCGI